jgi:hypothetical protein
VSDILNELRKRHRNVTGGNPLIDPIQGPTMFSEAANEIERLTAERDEARQMYCKMTSRDNVETARYIADRHGWDCFKEDGNA